MLVGVVRGWGRGKPDFLSRTGLGAPLGLGVMGLWGVTAAGAACAWFQEVEGVRLEVPESRLHLYPRKLEFSLVPWTGTL